MAGLAWVWPSGAERWRTPAIVAASFGLHAVVLGYIGPPCDRGRSPIADCEVEIHVDLFSSTRGWLPNLRGDDDD